MTHKFTDEELVSNYLETRQNDYFEQLYERYCTKVHRKCLSFTKDSEQAQDLTQDIFLRLITKLSGYRQQARFSTWLYSITHNYCTDQVRSPRWREEIIMGDNWDDVTVVADDGASDLDEQATQRVQQAMLMLKPEEQRLLRLKYQHDVSIKELASQNDLTESAVKMRLMRSRDRLRTHYARIGAD